jgi:hypothetical protein
VVKYGVHISQNEGYPLLFLQKYKFIPAPKLYAMYREGNTLYLIMSQMPGTQLASVWDDLSEDEKHHISIQLRAVWNHMRSIPSPTIFSGMSGGSLRHRFFLTLEPDPKITGPFKIEEDLNQTLVLRLQINWEGHRIRPKTPEYFARNLPKALIGHTSVFTHGDLQRKNILESAISWIGRMLAGIQAIGNMQHALWTLDGTMTGRRRLSVLSTPAL